jgi:multiple sugar transport system ATP-binding protein
MSVYENMAFGLKLKKTPKKVIDEKVRAAAKILDLEPLLDRKPKALSGGQRQRVALGRAIVREPKVFLMDEPLSNLDAMLRVQMRTEIAKLHQRLQTTFIYVTHDQTEAMTMGNRIVIMKDGIVQQIDTPQNVYDYPVNLFVAGFIGSPRMNIFKASVEYQDEKVYLKLCGGTRIDLTDKRQQTLKENNYIGKEIYVGIRPENLHDAQVDALEKDYSSISGVVEVAELLGSETYLYLTIEGNEIVARVNSKSTKRANDKAELHFHWNRLHLFDIETEKSIL